MQNPRRLAVEALLASQRGGYSNLILDGFLKSGSLSNADEAFLTALFYGTIERLITLENLLNRYSTVPVSKMKPELRAILLTAIYQILFMDKVPNSAAVNEAVLLTKQGKYRQLSGFVNGVLRSVARDCLIIQQELQQTTDLSLKYSCAPSFAAELENQYSRSVAEEFLANSLEAPPVFVRKNTLIELPFSDFDNYKSTDLADCYILSDAHRALHSPDFQNGLFHVEDKSCQIACNLLNPQPGDRVLDTCAAPGGKTLTMAQYMHNSGEIIACDLHAHRLRLIEQGAQRLQISIVRTIENDARNFNPEFGEFDKILCDVPCSGYGVIRRKPEIKQKEITQFFGLPQIQYSILETTSRYLKKGGFLMYSTCTVRQSENELVVKSFIEHHSGYKIVTMRQMLPQIDGTDGFFYCLLTR